MWNFRIWWRNRGEFTVPPLHKALVIHIVWIKQCHLLFNNNILYVCSSLKKQNNIQMVNWQIKTCTDSSQTLLFNNKERITATDFTETPKNRNYHCCFWTQNKQFYISFSSHYLFVIFRPHYKVDVVLFFCAKIWIRVNEIER